jgi:hypothetical protein
MRQTELILSKRDRQALDEFRSQGMHMARELNRAHIFAALDRKIPESQIMEVLGVGRTAIWRTRAAYLEARYQPGNHSPVSKKTSLSFGRTAARLGTETRHALALARTSSDARVGLAAETSKPPNFAGLTLLQWGDRRAV